MSTLSIITSVALSLLVAGCWRVTGNPILRNDDDLYCSYARLHTTADTTFNAINTLYNNFNDRLPGQSFTISVGVENLRSTGNVTRTENDLLAEHYEYLLKYQVIMAAIRDDEALETATTNYLAEVTEIQRWVGLTIVNLENVMIKLGVDLAPLPVLASGDTPRFVPTEDVIARYRRDHYVLEEMKDHFLEVRSDILKGRDGYVASACSGNVAC